MCGRFALTASGEEIASAFALDEAPEIRPRYNIAPTQPVLVVRRSESGGRGAESLRWGLSRPARESEGADPHSSGLLINARAETVARKPTFREAFRRRRCLIPATGFYEWKKVRGRGQPFFFRFRSGRAFAFAGLWVPEDDTASGRACAILTTEPNALLLDIHDRMPVIVRPEDYDLWLREEARHAALVEVFRPFPDEALVAQPVGPAVNSAHSEGPVCLAPPAPSEQAQGSLFPEDS